MSFSDVLNSIPEDYDLSDVRQEINEIDRQLLSLFIQRMHAAEKVAAIKKRTGAPIIQPDREQEILERVEREGGEYGGGARTLMATLIDISCTHQQMLLYGDDGKLRKKFLTAGKIIKGSKIACQGAVGAYSHLAAKQFFGEDTEPMFFPGFRDVFDAVTEEYADFGVLPLENTTAGAVNDAITVFSRPREPERRISPRSTPIRRRLPNARGISRPTASTPTNTATTRWRRGTSPAGTTRPRRQLPPPSRESSSDWTFLRREFRT